MDEGQGQRPVGARTHLKQHVGLTAEADPSRVHHHGLHAALARRDGVLGQHQLRGARVVPPQEEGAAVKHVRGRLRHAEGVAEHRVPVPVADVGGGNRVGASDTVEQARRPLIDVVRRGAAGGPPGHGDGLGAVAFPDAEQAGRDVVQRLVPADPLPARILGALGVGSAQRIVQAFAVVDQFRGSLALDTDGAAVGMIVVRIEPRHPPILHRRDGGAVGRAEHTVTPYLLHPWFRDHVRDPWWVVHCWRKRVNPGWARRRSRRRNLPRGLPSRRPRGR